MSRLSSILLIGSLSLAACDSSTLPNGPGGVEFLTEGAAGTPGWLLDGALEVRVTNSSGAPIAGAWVEWSSSIDGAFFTEESTQTDDDGIARVDFAPGWSLGLQNVTATVGEASENLSVTVTGMELIATEVLESRVCGLDTDGRMWCWPEYSHEVHPKRLEDVRRPIPVETALRFVALRGIAANFGDVGFICGITATGELWCASEDDFAGNDVVPTLHMIETPAPVSDWAGGGNFAENACILDTEGNAWCRGENSWGQLGDGTLTHNDAWQPVQGGLQFADITLGASDTCAITLDGEPYCWGNNSNEQLGIATEDTRLTTPTPVDGDLRLQRITQASGGLCGIAAFGAPELICWGQIFPAARISSTEPSGIQGVPLTASSIAGDWAGGRIVHDGRLYRFGYNGGWVSDFEFVDNKLEPHVTGVERLVSRTSYYWCVEHTSGSTICSTVDDRPVAVPLPLP